MNDNMRVSYSKAMREDARARGAVGLACIDIYPFDGTRITSKGPITRQDAEELHAFWLEWTRRRNARHAAECPADMVSGDA